MNLWRTLYFFTYEHEDTRESSRFRNDVDTFIAEEDKRRKNVCPDVGRLLTSQPCNHRRFIEPIFRRIGR